MHDPEVVLMQCFTSIVSLLDKFRCFFNSRAKKITAIVMLFLAFAAQLDLKVLLLTFPDFNQLTVNDGNLHFDIYKPRIGSQFSLILFDKKKVLFTCYVSGGSNIPCFLNKNISEFQGKKARAWTYEIDTYNIGNSQENLLFQLEIEGKIVMDYQSQKKEYINMKNNYIPIWTVLLFLSIVWLFILQLANNSSISKRN